ncbi:MAG: hypothetical protein JW870_17550 [Candidatus Delongbacteria bacterium]|nr:hypothetical protein [Candidatus Delongbacteria bacterium]
METTKTYDNFPVWIVFLSNIFSVLIYISGLVITLRLGWIAAVLYLGFIFAFEYRLISRHCINCFYWGRTCGFGKGRLSAMFFKRGDMNRFCDKEMTWKDMVPDLLISLIPLIIGIVLLIIKFDFIILFAAITIVLLTTFGNGFIRGTLTCRYCKQRELGCPADALFNREKK